MINQQTAQTIPVSAKQARIQFGELLEKAFYQGKNFMVIKKNKPMAVVVGMQAWKQMQQHRTKLKTKVRFKTSNLGKIKIPLTREYMYEPRGLGSV